MDILGNRMTILGRAIASRAHLPNRRPLGSVWPNRRATGAASHCRRPVIGRTVNGGIVSSAEFDLISSRPQAPKEFLSS
jgi:hypothetical protein